MSFTVVLIGLSLSMDAFAVSVGSGISIKGLKWFYAFRGAFFFGLFQFIMPVAGWYLGKSIFSRIEEYDHWIAFVLLVLIGGKMIKESFDIKISPGKNGGARKIAADIRSLGTLFLLTIATSIDALAVGVSYSVLDRDIWSAAGLIGGITFIVCMAGFELGKRIGLLFEKAAQITGGLILIGIGVKILVEHIVK
ncbi:MAG: manganese efflux pump MntP family protein [Treponema sp.]|jgi:putative Mn2+ efflux pump MntP|nr:manganese efflux pump MntP family protein [Treponema sp.]